MDNSKIVLGLVAMFILSIYFGKIGLSFVMAGMFCAFISLQFANRVLGEIKRVDYQSLRRLNSLMKDCWWWLTFALLSLVTLYPDFQIVIGIAGILCGADLAISSQRIRVKMA